MEKNFNELKFFNEEVKDAMLQCRKMGYDIYISKWTFSVHDIDGGRVSYFDFKEPDNLAIGYCQFGTYNCFDRWSFSTHHKPNRETGSGWNVIDRVWDIKPEHFEQVIAQAKRNFIYGGRQGRKTYPPEKPVDFVKYQEDHYKIIFDEVL